MVHEGRWQIVQSDDGRMLGIPPTTTFGQARGRVDLTSSAAWVDLAVGILLARPDAAVAEWQTR